MKKNIQIFLLALFCLIGIISGLFENRDLPEPTWWTLFSTFLVSATIFYWYHIDSSHKEFNRPFLLSVGVVAVAPLAVPLYVFSSTERGLRLRALGRLFGYFCLIFLVCVVGWIAGFAIA